MKKSICLVLLAICFAVVSGSAEARERTTRTHTTTSTTDAPVASHMSAPDRVEHHSGSGSTAFSLGLSSITPTGATALGLTGSLTGIIDFTNVDALQILLSIPSTTGGFSFGVGGFYKRTVWGNAATGFHLGGGAGIGTNAGNFALTIDAIAGVHYNLANTPVSFHLDGGAVFGLTSVSAPVVVVGGAAVGGGSATTTNFSLGALSNILGASVVYMF